MANLTLDAQPRELTRRKVRRLRREGMVPVVIYGHGQEPENAQVNARALEKVLRSGGTAQIVQLNLAPNGQRNILIREVQRHPVRHAILHADFYAVSMSEKQQVSVPVVAVGEPAGSGSDVVLVQMLDHVEVEALPADIPAHIEVDVSVLESADSEPITVGDLPPIAGVEYITPASETVFSLIVTRAAAAAETEEEAVDMEAEPEVIGRSQDEEDGAG